MSFPRFYYPDITTTFPSFSTDISRLIDDLDSFVNPSSERRTGGATTGSRRAFSPNFDVHETEHEYVLEGEVPGVSDKNSISIEFIDDKTMYIQGRIERSVKRWSDDQGRIKSIEEGSGSQQKNITSGGEEAKKKTEANQQQQQHSEGNNTQVSKEKADNTKPKFWVSERSVGEFSRNFSFPSPVDIDRVKASLEHGILKIVVPKMEKRTGRKVQISS